MKSRLGYLFGGALLIVAIAVFIVGIGSTFSNLENMPRVAMPGSATLDMPIGPSTLYFETRSTIGGKLIESSGDFELDCELESSAGHRKVALMAPSSSVSYELTGYRGRNAYDVNVDSGGTYTLRCRSDGNKPFAIAIGTGAGSGMVVAALAAVPFLGGFALLLVTFLRRFRAARRLAAGR
jgi:hypothetical protein